MVQNSRSSVTRLAVTVLAVFAIVASFAVRLVDIQVVRASELATAAVDGRSMQIKTYGLRGEILDANGVVLADSVERFDITAAPDMVPEDQQTELRRDGEWVDVSVADALAAVSEITGEPLSSLQAAIADPEARFAFLAKGVTLDVFRQVSELRIPWVYDKLRPSRSYPNGAVAGNLIGFVGSDGPQAGIELSENDCLAQTDGTATYERGADGVRIPGSTVTATEPVNGGNVRLTIDRDLQWFVQEALAEQAQAIGAEWATAVVVRVADAHILALADYPTVDPNAVGASDPAARGSIAFSSPYEPGSTFKAMTIASLLDAGVVTPETEFVVPGRYKLPSGGTIGDAFAHGELHLTAAGIITQSSNVGVSLLSEQLDAGSRHDYMVEFGVGAKTAVDFPGESTGLLRPAEDWDQVTTRAVQFGQGVSATSAQVASIYQTIGNDGVRLPLVLVQGCEWPDGSVTGQPNTEGTRVVSETASEQTVRILETVVTDGWLANQLAIPGYRVAAKTGTAEVADDSGYGNERIVSVAGLAPAEDPEYVVVATFAKPKRMNTSAAAAPTFQEIMSHVLKKYRVVPSTTPAPPLRLAW